MRWVPADAAGRRCRCTPASPRRGTSVRPSPGRPPGGRDRGPWDGWWSSRGSTGRASARSPTRAGRALAGRGATVARFAFPRYDDGRARRARPRRALRPHGRPRGSVHGMALLFALDRRAAAPALRAALRGPRRRARRPLRRLQRRLRGRPAAPGRGGGVRRLGPGAGDRAVRHPRRPTTSCSSAVPARWSPPSGRRTGSAPRPAGAATPTRPTPACRSAPARCTPQLAAAAWLSSVDTVVDGHRPRSAPEPPRTPR